MYPNDPYQGNTHLPDFIMAKPIFFSGQIVGYSAVRGHYVDVGGGGPGSYSATMPDIYAEGLRIPPVRIYEEGKDQSATSSTYSCTTRAIRANAMAICVRNTRAASRQSGASSASVRSMGSRPTKRRWRKSLTRPERLTRGAIEKIPDGTYSFEDYCDDDAIGDEPIKIAAKVTVNGDNIHVDFAGLLAAGTRRYERAFGGDGVCHLLRDKMPYRSGKLAELGFLSAD